ncbi:MAG TPA: nucleotidyltransferase family protein [Candidatus Sumerlaeota bacterium]|nr:nucleotidyltransferase family protein [Candidatus Sumerlaeota bacterium]
MNATSRSSHPAQLYAIIPAAGRSRRMGRPKSLIDVRGQPMLARVVEPLVAAGLEGVLIVTNAALAARLGGLGAAVAVNPDPAAEMIDSVRLGMRWWEAARPIGPQDGFVVCPGDQPGLTARDIAACAAAYRREPARIVIAGHGGRRGHPLIFPAARRDFVYSPACDYGLNQLARRHAADVVTVDLPNPAVIRNVNTPTDLARLITDEPD